MSDLTQLHRLMIVWEATAILRHDLRNKLASVRNAAFFLQRKIESGGGALIADEPRIPTFFGMIKSESDAAVALIADRLPALPPTPVAASIDLADVAADALAHVRVPDGVTVVAPVAGVAGHGDRAELAVATLCLIENAVESGARTVRITCTASDGTATIAVSDDGPGLGAAADRAVEHFFTTRAGHLGLGLAIAKRLVARSGGELALGAGPDGGARVAHGEGVNILLVEDDDAVRLTVGALLEDDGHAVVEASTVADAWQHVDAFELAIVDLHLPDGSGAALIRELRARRPDAVIVLMTGADADPGAADLVVAKDRPPAEVVALAAPMLARRRAGS